MDQILLAVEKAIVTICEKFSHLLHIVTIGLWLNRSKEEFSCGELNHKKDRTSHQFTADT